MSITKEEAQHAILLKMNGEHQGGLEHGFYIIRVCPRDTVHRVIRSMDMKFPGYDTDPQTEDIWVKLLTGRMKIV